MRLRPVVRGILAAFVAVAIVAGAAGAATSTNGSGGTRHITAYFTKVIGLYKGNDVRILGVRVGKIDSLKVMGTVVQVKMSYDGKYKLPADAGAVIVPPSVVSDRYVQLTPAYTGGPTLPDHAVLQTDRTQVPLEFDEIFKNLDQLNVALGPNGANKNGALSRLVDVSAANLGGNGAQLNAALKQFSQMISTLSGSRGDLFGTIRNLQQFTTMLAHNDGGIRALNANLAKVGTQLAGERQDLGAALANLSSALKVVSGFVASNRTELTTDIKKAAEVTNVLSREKEALEQIIDTAPYGLINLSLAYDSKAHTLDTLSASGGPFQANPTAPNGILCQLVPSTCAKAGTPAAKAKNLFDLLKVVQK
jgi:virulence factor Mce-like protein